MNARRASAYMRVVRAVDDLATVLEPSERQALRDAADARLFAGDEVDVDAEQALGGAEAMLDGLVGEDRLAPWAADHIAHDLELCGPAAPVRA